VILPPGFSSLFVLQDISKINKSSTPLNDMKRSPLAQVSVPNVHSLFLSLLFSGAHRI